MDAELRELLERFLAGTLSVADLTDEVEPYDIWSARQDADPEIVALRGPVGRLELCTTEILEGMRPEAELRELAYELLQRDIRAPHYCGLNEELTSGDVWLPRGDVVSCTDMPRS